MKLYWLDIDNRKFDSNTNRQFGSINFFDWLSIVTWMADLMGFYFVFTDHMTLIDLWHASLIRLSSIWSFVALSPLSAWGSWMIHDHRQHSIIRLDTPHTWNGYFHNVNTIIWPHSWLPALRLVAYYIGARRGHDQDVWNAVFVRGLEESRTNGASSPCFNLSTHF